MPRLQSRSVHDIKNDSDRTRMELAETVGQLRDQVTDTANDVRERIRPEAIKTEISSYLTKTREQWMDGVTTAARDNPVQAVAIGATLAYPLFRLARSVPFPLLMIGAGLALTTSKGGKLRGASSRFAGDAAGQESISERVTDFVSSNHPMAVGVKSAGQAAKDAAASVQSMMASASETTERTVSDTLEKGFDSARTVRDGAVDLSGRAREAVLANIGRNPLLVAGVGFVLGGLLGSSLPPTEVEGNLMGRTSGHLRRQAEAAASSGLDAAKDMADDVYSTVSQKAQSEGLGPEPLQHAAQDLGQRLKHVAERAVTTAFEPEENYSPNTRGETDNDQSNT